MFKLSAVLFLFIISLNTNAQISKSAYNKVLADSLGADEYGMKMYVLVILKTGDTKISDKKINDSLFTGHMQNIGRLAKIGKLVAAGPLQKNEKNYEGIFILNVKSSEEAKLLLNTDPAISAGVLNVELYQWYGSAALPMYLKFHESVQKVSF